MMRRRVADTFASLLAIKSDDNADNAVGNVTGSNSVNVFLGLGMPWLAATAYWALEWTSASTGTAENPGPCRSLDTCTGDENYARQKWLATYQVGAQRQVQIVEGLAGVHARVAMMTTPLPIFVI